MASVDPTALLARGLLIFLQCAKHEVTKTTLLQAALDRADNGSGAGVMRDDIALVERLAPGFKRARLPQNS